ncbi:hypothetical protein CLAVI_000493 [Candidatus Clavichlamydia salmonicola]|uniref:hypothetical protein n=1 Tax=Candidatus Clavichlamydia salmonicola TaxID=469812 RepID=UPI0018913420|nr:hypothetical protein [Candidatus Clavichlamydia salmonicola]MBF5050871.1 hypothetical protein [Candidatus Clavichlamydia salmonicola]
MIHINNILSYAGLRAPTSTTEAIKNLKNNSRTLLKITSSAILGISGICAGLLCYDCPLCQRISNSNDSLDFNNLSTHIFKNNNYHLPNNTRSLATITVNVIMNSNIIYLLFSHVYHSCFYALTSTSKLSATYGILKTCVLFALIMTEFYSILECILNMQQNTFPNAIICSTASLMNTVLGIGYCIYALKKLTLLILPANLPHIPESIEMTLLNPLSIEGSHPLQPLTTQLLDLFGRVDQIFSQLLNQALNDDAVLENDVKLMLDAALYLIKKIHSIFLKELASYGQFYILEINELSLILKNITPPLHKEGNIIAISSLLARLHTLIRGLVALHPIAVPTEIQLALPSFQALCPPPEYSEENMPEINTSATSHPLYLASPPSYEEYSLRATRSF